jgi:excisionase family DNA binding protein
MNENRTSSSGRELRHPQEALEACMSSNHDGVGCVLCIEDRNTPERRYRVSMESTDTTEVTGSKYYVSYVEAERMFSLSRTTLWRLLKAGEIEGVRVGRALRLKVASIEKFMETRKV